MWIAIGLPEPPCAPLPVNAASWSCASSVFAAAVAALVRCGETSRAPADHDEHEVRDREDHEEPDLPFREGHPGPPVVVVVPVAGAVVGAGTLNCAEIWKFTTLDPVEPVLLTRVTCVTFGTRARIERKAAMSFDEKASPLSVIAPPAALVPALPEPRVTLVSVTFDGTTYSSCVSSTSHDTRRRERGVERDVPRLHLREHDRDLELGRRRRMRGRLLALREGESRLRRRQPLLLRRGVRLLEEEAAEREPRQRQR